MSEYYLVSQIKRNGCAIGYLSDDTMPIYFFGDGHIKYGEPGTQHNYSIFERDDCEIFGRVFFISDEKIYLVVLSDNYGEHYLHVNYMTGSLICKKICEKFGIDKSKIAWVKNGEKNITPISGANSFSRRVDEIIRKAIKKLLY